MTQWETRAKAVTSVRIIWKEGRYSVRRDLPKCPRYTSITVTITTYTRGTQEHWPSRFFVNVMVISG